MNNEEHETFGGRSAISKRIGCMKIRAIETYGEHYALEIHAYGDPDSTLVARRIYIPSGTADQWLELGTFCLEIALKGYSKR
jgi:hypothetical protein